MSLLGSLLIDPEHVLPKVADLLEPSDFSQPAHQHIYQATMELYGERKELDVLTLSETLQRQGYLDLIGGAAYLTLLTNAVPTVTHASDYARIVADFSTKRRLLSTTAAINDATANEGDIDSLLAKAESAIFAVGKRRVKQNTESLSDILTQTLSRMEQAQNGTLVRGVSTGYQEADGILTGLQNSDLIVIAARPAMGKTAFALNLARNVGIMQNVPTLIFSLEMSKDQLVDRLLSMETSIPTDRLRGGMVTTEEMDKVVNTMGILADAPVYIDDTPNVTIQMLRARARREDHLHHLGLIIVDYLQLMSGMAKRGQTNREQEIAEISRGLKIIARELNIPVIALSQLSRMVETRTPQIPQLSDLRESGAIEQNADIVAFLYRDDYYNPDTLRQNMTDLIIRKHRNGRIGSVEFYFDKAHQRFRGMTIM